MFVFPTTPTSPRRATSDVVRARLFEHRYAEREDAGSSPRLPAIDVAETDTCYTVTCDVPGLTKDQLKVSVRGRRVELETTDPAPTPTGAESSGKLLYRERATPRYARTVALPTEVDPENAVAKYENGVLILTLTKKVPTGATRLDIS